MNQINVNYIAFDRQFIVDLIDELKEKLRNHHSDCPIQELLLYIDHIPCDDLESIDWNLDLNTPCEDVTCMSHEETKTTLHGLYHSFNDQPAIIDQVYNFKYWDQCHLHHRLRGPATIDTEDRNKTYYVHGKQTTARTLRLVRRFATNLINHLKKRYKQEVLATSILPGDLITLLVIPYVL